jgi:hypothetical protein
MPPFLLNIVWTEGIKEMEKSAFWEQRIFITGNSIMNPQVPITPLRSYQHISDLFHAQSSCLCVLPVPNRVLFFFFFLMGLHACKADILPLKPHLLSILFCLCFGDGVLICLGWLQIVVLLISASQVGRFIGMRHQCLASK